MSPMKMTFSSMPLAADGAPLAMRRTFNTSSSTACPKADVIRPDPKRCAGRIREQTGHRRSGRRLNTIRCLVCLSYFKTTRRRLSTVSRFRRRTGNPNPYWSNSTARTGGRQAGSLNWRDPNTPLRSANCANVEWTGWGPEHAVKIAWAHCRQIRVAPPPNLMSPSYRNACREKMKLLVPIILHWYQNLPPSDRHLFIGLNVGWESSIGVNAWHYPDGNRLLDRPPDEDPQTGLDLADVTARGQVWAMQL